MKIFALAVVFLATSIFILPGVLLADEDLDNPDLRVSEGLVTAVDVSSGIVTVDAGIPMVFPVSSDTKLYSEATMYLSDIKLSDIGVGDYVSVGYIREGQSSRTPSKTLKITVENKAGGNN